MSKDNFMSEKIWNQDFKFLTIEGEVYSEMDTHQMCIYFLEVYQPTSFLLIMNYTLRQT